MQVHHDEVTGLGGGGDVGRRDLPQEGDFGERFAAEDFVQACWVARPAGVVKEQRVVE